MCLVQTEGRQLPLEKIILGSTSFQSSPQADWGQQAVKEQVITPVPLRNWLVLYVNRDKSKALDFVTMMNKVTPAMGIEVSVLASATSKAITSHLAMFISLSCHALGKKRLSTTELLPSLAPPLSSSNGLFEFTSCCSLCLAFWSSLLNILVKLYCAESQNVVI